MRVLTHQQVGPLTRCCEVSLASGGAREDGRTRQDASKWLKLVIMTHSCIFHHHCQSPNPQFPPATVVFCPSVYYFHCWICCASTTCCLPALNRPDPVAAASHFRFSSEHVSHFTSNMLQLKLKLRWRRENPLVPRSYMPFSNSGWKTSHSGACVRACTYACLGLKGIRAAQPKHVVTFFFWLLR